MTALPFAKQWQIVGDAMAESVKRARAPRNLAEALEQIEGYQENTANLEQQIANLKQVLQMRDRRILDLTDEAARLRGEKSVMVGQVVEQQVASARGIYSGSGEEVVSVKEFAAMHGAKISTIIRRLNNGTVRGFKEDGYHWKVIANQPYKPYQRKRRV